MQRVSGETGEIAHQAKFTSSHSPCMISLVNGGRVVEGGAGGGGYGWCQQIKIDGRLCGGTRGMVVYVPNIIFVLSRTAILSQQLTKYLVRLLQCHRMLWATTQESEAERRRGGLWHHWLWPLETHHD